MRLTSISADMGDHSLSRKQEAHADRRVDRAEGGESTDGRELLGVERAGVGRKRPMARPLRRIGEHGSKHAHLDEVKVTRRESLSFSMEDHEAPPGEEEAGAAEQGGEAEEASADFMTLANHLSRLDGLTREVTLYLPSLGRVTARQEAGALTILACVPRRLVAAVRRGEAELQQRLAHAGLKVAQIKISSQADPGEEAPAASSKQREPLFSHSSLVDVMA